MQNPQFNDAITKVYSIHYCSQWESGEGYSEWETYRTIESASTELARLVKQNKEGAGYVDYWIAEHYVTYGSRVYREAKV